jgi:putative component of membrane protein insertase Oxa1/YidC/SpoIIIJ protein YidD
MWIFAFQVYQNYIPRHLPASCRHAKMFYLCKVYMPKWFPDLSASRVDMCNVLSGSGRYATKFYLYQVNMPKIFTCLK